MLHEHVPIDVGMREVKTGLMNSISLQLWLVKLLQEGRVDEEQFIKMNREYESQIDQFMSQRKEMLEEAQNLDTVKTLNEVKIYYDELKKKRELGIISEEEYNIKARSYVWEINNLNEEIHKQEEKIEFLKDASHGKPLEEVIKEKTNAEKYRKEMATLKGSRGIGQETITIVEKSLDKVLNYFEEFGEVVHKPKISTSEIIYLQEEHQDLYKPGYILINEKKPEIRKLKVEEKKDEIQDIVIKVRKETIEKGDVVRVMCPYDDNKGDKCKVIAFGKTEVNAYQKLENHIKKHHPEKLMDIKRTYARV